MDMCVEKEVGEEEDYNMVKITFEKILDEGQVRKLLRKVNCRGIYNKSGEKIKPYKNAKFSLATIYPPKQATGFPQLKHNGKFYPLFTSQPTIYKDITDIMKEVDEFLKTINKRIFKLKFEAIQYYWEGRGRYHMLPPIIEKQRYPLKEGKFDQDKLVKKFRGCYVKDAKEKFHDLSQRILQDFYIDNYTKIDFLDIFNPNLELISYGLMFNGLYDFYIICDGSHRLDYAIQILNKPMKVIVVEAEDLLPYYALPMPFLPLTRLSSKIAEKKYPNLERDKVHLLNDILKKFLHYDWEAGGLLVSKLRRKDLLEFLW